MKSKMLLISNIVASLYSAFLVIWFLIINGDEIKTLYDVADFLGAGEKIIVILLWGHIIVFVLATILGWISYKTTKSKLAKFSAILILIGTIIFPIYYFFCIPITIIAFIGYSRQKKLEKSSK